ncbi:MAG: hypothetical protein ACRDNA_13350, partial [Gaiellaceae bacterium]
MSVVEPAVSPKALNEFPVAVDQRTLHILERRRAASTHMRRGWLVRRALAAADLVGLTIAFLAASVIFDMPARSDTVKPEIELLFFLLSLPAWLVVA